MLSTMISLSPNVIAEYASVLLGPNLAVSLMDCGVEGVACELDGDTVIASVDVNGVRASFPLATHSELVDGTWKQRALVRMMVLASGLGTLRREGGTEDEVVHAREVWALMAPAESFQGEEAK